MSIINLKEDLKTLLHSRWGTQTEISAKTGIPLPTLWRYANNPKRDIPFSRACKLIPLVYPHLAYLFEDASREEDAAYDSLSGLCLPMIPRHRSVTVQIPQGSCHE